MQYKDGEEVVVWMNTVGPYDNRQETYEFFQLPYCVGESKVSHYHESLGEALLGIELKTAGIPMKFKVDQDKTTLCERSLSPKDMNIFRYAINNKYWYQLYIDDLPIGAYVGELDKTAGADPFLFTHKDFLIKYNGDQIIEITMNFTNEKLTLESDKDSVDARFTWSVKWVETDRPFSTRFNVYLDEQFFEHKIHWFSIFNSFMIVVFLIGLVGVILLRTLRRDYARYDKEDGMMDLDRDLGDEFGWKQVHGDVFRSPSHLTLFSALLGTGFQLCVLTLSIILYTIMGDLYAERATILTATIFLYALTAMFSGYYAGSFYTKYGGKNWISAVFLTAGLFPGTVGLIAFLINFVAISYTSSRAIPFGTMVAILAIWLFIVFPLTLVGAIFGRRWAGQPNFPCRINPIPRPVPDKIWYAEPIVIIGLGGILPFGSIFIEMYFIFTSFWAYKIYYVYGFMLVCVLSRLSRLLVRLSKVVA
ncbi:Transmembrane 9 super member 3 [Borealophlyctis nickersoniae]|nr:Transmembrane 9 super member 3 [Borealophlyctis nickersoniae]